LGASVVKILLLRCGQAERSLWLRCPMVDFEHARVVRREALADEIRRTKTDICGGGGRGRVKVLIQIYLVINFQTLTGKAQIVEARIFKKPYGPNPTPSQAFDFFQPLPFKPSSHKRRKQAQTWHQAACVNQAQLHTVALNGLNNYRA
jgi:hypothetical protein